MSSRKEYTTEELKSMLDDGEIDLSLSELTSVPAMQLAKVNRLSKLDLSLNKLTILPPEFCKSLRNLVRLDLSKNQITVLPEDIGLLQHLQHLDLYRNQLKIIPLNFGKLNSLKWLDLKDNPLSDELLKVTGGCLDNEQCRKCATNVVDYLKKAQSAKDRQMDIQREKKLERQRFKDEEVKKKEKLEKERLKREKQAQKEAKRKQWNEEHPEVNNRTNNSVTKKEEIKTTTIKKKLKSKKSSCWVLLAVLIAIFASGIGTFNMFCKTNSKDSRCVKANKFLLESKNTTIVFMEKMQNHTSVCWVAGKAFLTTSKEKLEDVVDDLPAALKNVSSFLKRMFKVFQEYLRTAVEFILYYWNVLVELCWPYIGDAWLAVKPHVTKAKDVVCTYITKAAMAV